MCRHRRECCRCCRCRSCSCSCCRCDRFERGSSAYDGPVEVPNDTEDALPTSRAVIAYLHFSEFIRPRLREAHPDATYMDRFLMVEEVRGHRQVCVRVCVCVCPAETAEARAGRYLAVGVCCLLAWELRSNTVLLGCGAKTLEHGLGGFSCWIRRRCLPTACPSRWVSTFLAHFPP